MAFPVWHLGVATLLVLLAAGWDAWRRRIPNAVNALLGLTGLWAQANVRGWLSMGYGLLAGLLTIAVLWMPWMKGRIGGGDVKMAAGAAIWLGLPVLLVYWLATAVAGGVVAVICYALSNRAARRQIRENLATAVAAQSLPEIPIRGAAGRLSVPYGVAVAMAGLLLLWRGALS